MPIPSTGVIIIQELSSKKTRGAMIKKNENIVARKIHGSYFLVDISDNYSFDKCALYEINETGLFIWDSIIGTRSVEELAELLKEAIIEDLDIQVLHDDVKDFVDALAIKNFLEV